jgi:hypothetical protein
VRYDIGVTNPADVNYGLAFGIADGYLNVSASTLAEVEAEANRAFTKVTSLSELQFIGWQGVIVADAEFLGIDDESVRFPLDYSGLNVFSGATNRLKFTAFALSQALIFGLFK